jgi:hypothetical protein
MAGLTDAEEAKLLDDRYDGVELWLAASTADPTEDGSGLAEPSGNNYSRVSVDGNNGAWDAATVGAPTTKVNANKLSFPEASGDWGTITHLALLDAQAGGSVRAYAALGSAQSIGDGDNLEVPAGDLTLKLGDPSDTY